MCVEMTSWWLITYGHTTKKLIPQCSGCLTVPTVNYKRLLGMCREAKPVEVDLQCHVVTDTADQLQNYAHTYTRDYYISSLGTTILASS